MTVFVAGHAGGLLIPQRYFDMAGIGEGAHLAIAYWMRLLVGTAAFVGCVLLLWRRLSDRRVRAAGTINDIVTLGELSVVVGLGLYNVIFGHFNVLDTVAPWIRGIVFFSPDAELMRPAPLGYKIHVLAACALPAFSRFSRLVHIWSIPLTYLFRAKIVFRKNIGRRLA